MRTKVKGPVLVALTWTDAHSDLEQTWGPNDFSHRPINVTTVGWVLQHDEHGITMMSEQIEDTEESSYRSRTFVPAGMIVSLTPLSFKRSRKPRRASVSPPDRPPAPPTAD